MTWKGGSAMRDEQFRQSVHRAIDMPAQQLPDDPFLANRILALANEKERPRVKRKLSVGLVLAIIMVLTSLTALAVGLTAHEIWQESFLKMNTTGEINIISDPTEDDMPVEEAIAMAREAIKEKYAATDAELDAMGVYPNFIGRDWEWSDGTEPDEWQIFISSRTDMSIDLSTERYGAAGEYRVYIDAEAKEVTYCHWYTEDFWARAGRIWDQGNHDLVYGYYKGNTFYTLSVEEQARWEALFAAEGYELRSRDTLYHDLLLRGALDILFREGDEYALAADDPQCIAAWQVLEEQYGLEKALLEKYYFRAGRLGMHTGTDDIFIAYSFNWAEAPEELETEPVRTSMCYFTRCLGIYLISFAPGTTEVQAVTHLLESEEDRVPSVTEGLPLQKNDWTADDLLFFDKVVTAYAAARERMLAADAIPSEENLVRNAVMRYLGGDPELYDYVSEGYDVSMWFSDETAPKRSALREAKELEDAEKERLKAEAIAQYGDNVGLWPLNIQAAVYNNHFDRREGELTREQAIEKARAAVIAQKGEGAIKEGWITCVFLHRYLSEQGEVSSWMVNFYDPNDMHETEGWYATFYDTGAEWMGEEITVTSLAEGVG